MFGKIVWAVDMTQASITLNASRVTGCSRSRPWRTRHRQIASGVVVLAALSAAGVLVPAEVGPDIIAEVVARRAGIPISRMMESERERLLKLEERLRERVLGQDDAAGCSTPRP